MFQFWREVDMECGYVAKNSMLHMEVLSSKPFSQRVVGRNGHCREWGM